MKVQKTLALVGLVASPLALALATVAVPKLAAILFGFIVFFNFVFTFLLLAFGLMFLGGLSLVFGGDGTGDLLIA
jgi:hypothetical protein